MSDDPRRRGWRPRAITWLAALCALAGIVLLTYTPAASWLSQYQQSQLLAAYNSQMRRNQAAAEADNQPSQEFLAAQEYNTKLSSGAIVASNSNVPHSATESVPDGYYQVLMGPGEVMARIRIPRIDVDMPIYHGTDDETLLRGAGHLHGTSLPVGGESTHAVVTAHRGLAEATMFTNLDQLGPGDVFSIEVQGQVLAYEVESTQVVAPEEQEALYPQQGRDLMTLVTCTPLGINTHRILVTGVRIEPTPSEIAEDALSDSQLPRFPWWAVAAGVATLCVFWFLWRSGLRDAALVSSRESVEPAQQD